ESQSWHELMYCDEMSLHVVMALDSTELVEETNIRGSEGRQRLVSRCRVGFAPHGEPAVYLARGRRIHGVRDEICEQGKLEAPALLMLIEGVGIGEFVRELQQRPLWVPVEPNRDSRAPGRGWSAAL